MLFIFDLDDTLIETTEKITPVRLQKALNKVIEAGLKIVDYDKALKLLKRLNFTCQSSRQTLSEFIELYGGNKDQYQLAQEIVYHSKDSESDCLKNESTLKILSEIAQSHTLAIVTHGNFNIQMQKIKRFGIDEDLFCDIIVTDKNDKGIHYEEIMTKRGFEPFEVVVIGDRISSDLEEAVFLGCTTVHVRQGRGAQIQDQQFYIDYTISDLNDLNFILETIEQRTILETI